MQNVPGRFGLFVFGAWLAIPWLWPTWTGFFALPIQFVLGVAAIGLLARPLLQSGQIVTLAAAGFLAFSTAWNFFGVVDSNEDFVSVSMNLGEPTNVSFGVSMSLRALVILGAALLSDLVRVRLNDGRWGVAADRFGRNGTVGDSMLELGGRVTSSDCGIPLLRLAGRR
jgi:hypothetical protein